MYSTGKQYKCKHFKIYELVPPHIYEQRKEKAWQLLDNRMLWTIDLLRDLYGPIIINNYHSGRPRTCSGLRTPECEIYSPTSQHSFGRAFDCIFTETDVEKIRQDILENTHTCAYQYITAMELNTSWLHIDCRNCDRILTFRP